MYLNLIQIAESFGVSEHTVTEWVRKEGMPHVHDRERILFERAPVMAWAARKGLVAQAGFLALPAADEASAIDLAKLLGRGRIWRDIAPQTLPDILARIFDNLPGVTRDVRDMLAWRIRSSEGLTIAPVGGGFALPHPCSGAFLGEACALVALIELNAPLPGTDAPDTAPITRLLFFLSPSPRQHVNMLGLLARSVASGELARAMDAGLDDEALTRALVDGSKSPSATSQGASR